MVGTISQTGFAAYKYGRKYPGVLVSSIDQTIFLVDADNHLNAMYFKASGRVTVQFAHASGDAVVRLFSATG